MTCFHDTPALVVGVDPGLTGAVAILTPAGHLVDVYDLPVIDKTINCAELARYEGWRTHPERFHAVIEQVASRPKQGVASVFRFGHVVGSLDATFAVLGIPTTRVTPGVWKRWAGIGPDKNDARRRATELWPSSASSFARVKDHGRAEAALIARWWVETRGRKT